MGSSYEVPACGLAGGAQLVVGGEDDEDLRSHGCLTVCAVQKVIDWDYGIRLWSGWALWETEWFGTRDGER